MSRHTRERIIVLLIVSLLVLSGTAALASAQQFGPGAEGTSGAIVRIDAGETYDGDLQAAAGSVVIAGTVDGNVEVAGGSVVITESGRVTGSVDAAAASVVIEGTVDGDVSVGGAAFEVREGAQIGGALEAGAADARIDGQIDGDTTIGADSLAVGPAATIGGTLRYDAAEFSISDEATVSGSVVRDESLSVAGPDVFGSGAELPTIPAWVGAVYGALVNLLLGAILLLVAPKLARSVVSAGMSNPVRNGGIGLLVLIGTPILLLLLLLTIIGIPVSLAGAVIFGLVLWITSVYGMIIFGTALLSLLDRENRWAALVVGVVALAILDAIPVVGGLISFVVLLIGLGAFAVSIYNRSRGGDSSPGVAAVDAEPTV